MGVRSGAKTRIPPPGNWDKNQIFLEKPEVGILIPTNDLILAMTVFLPV